MHDPMPSERIHGDEPPSQWIVDQLAIRADGLMAIDLACGTGRHTRVMAPRFNVLAIDRNPRALQQLDDLPGVKTLCQDLETPVWPLAASMADLVVVSNYFWRPHLHHVFALVRPGGWLLYETFSVGNERYGKPSNPDFLVRNNELREAVPDNWSIHSHWQGYTDLPKPAMRVRLAAQRH